MPHRDRAGASLITWWPRPFQITIGARRLQLKSDSSGAARTVTQTSISAGSPAPTRSVSASDATSA